MRTSDSTLWAILKFSKLYKLYRRVIKGIPPVLTDRDLGNYLEFGASSCRSLACIHRVRDKSKLGNIRLFAFDSFEALPESSSN